MHYPGQSTDRKLPIRTNVQLRQVAPTGSSTPDMNLDQVAQIESWTEQTVDALRTVSISGLPEMTAEATSITLSIPLDDTARVPEQEANGIELGRPRRQYSGRYVGPEARQELMRRDSLKRREALLKGKEGSRQRRRWENDRLLSNPWAQPPLPSDYEVRPTHRMKAVPYYLASLWDDGLPHRRWSKSHRRRPQVDPNDKQDPATRVTKEVRSKLRRARAAKGLLQDLEQDVRSFLEQWSKQPSVERDDELMTTDSEDDEIVFVGRREAPDEARRRQVQLQELNSEKLIFDALADDQGANFGRWLVHSIADYYGLRTWSVTTGDPARRAAYIGIDEHGTGMSTTLPRPLWAIV